MNKFLEKLMKIFRRGKKEEVLVLNEGEKQNQNQERTQEGVFPYKVKEPNFVQKRIMAENEVMKLVAQEEKIDKKIQDLNRTAGIDEDNLTITAQKNKRDTEISMEFMMANTYFKVFDALEELYENSDLTEEIDKFLYDSEYQIEDRKKAELIEKIKKYRAKDNGLVIEQYLKGQIRGNFDGNLHKYIECYKMNEEEFIDKVIESTLEVIKLETQRETEILPTRYGIQYSQIDSFDEKNYDLPPELEEVDVEEYKRKEKEKLIAAYSYIIEKGTLTDGQKTVFQEYLRTTVFEGKAIQMTQEEAEKQLEEVMKSGEINAEFTKFSARQLGKIIMNTKEGVQKGPKEHNYKLPYVYYKENEEGAYRVKGKGICSKVVKYLEGQPKQKEQTGVKEIVE